jgi:hypothetical protein
MSKTLLNLTEYESDDIGNYSSSEKALQGDIDSIDYRPSRRMKAKNTRRFSDKMISNDDKREGDHPSEEIPDICKSNLLA